MDFTKILVIRTASQLQTDICSGLTLSLHFDHRSCTFIITNTIIKVEEGRYMRRGLEVTSVVFSFSYATALTL